MVSTEAAIWTRIIHRDGKLSPAAARAILELSIPDTDKERMHTLAEKNQQGLLTDEEEAELDEYCRVGELLGILKSKARKVLHIQPAAK